MPSGKIDLPVIEDNRDGTVRIQYDPKEDGVHELVLLHNGVPVNGNFAEQPRERCSQILPMLLYVNVVHVFPPPPK